MEDQSNGHHLRKGKMSLASDRLLWSTHERVKVQISAVVPCCQGFLYSSSQPVQSGFTWGLWKRLWLPSPQGKGLVLMQRWGRASNAGLSCSFHPWEGLAQQSRDSRYTQHCWLHFETTTMLFLHLILVFSCFSHISKYDVLTYKWLKLSLCRDTWSTSWSVFSS